MWEAAEEAESLRRSAYQEAMQTRENAQAYVEQVLNNLERDIDQVHRIVKNGQEYLSNQKNQASIRFNADKDNKTYAEQ